MNPPSFAALPIALETCIRSALETGELLPGVESQLQKIQLDGNLTEKDCSLLDLLQDAIQSGCIRRTGLLRGPEDKEES